MKKLLMIGALACSSVGAQDAMTQSVRLTLRVDNGAFLESQAIWAYVALCNYTSANQEVQPSVLSEDPTRGIRFRLLFEDRTSMTQLGGVIIDDFGTPKARTIAPGDSITQAFNIITWFSTSGIQGADNAFYLPTMHYLKAGSYAVQAMQFTGKDTLRSNEVRFIVVKPTGKELQAWQALKEADKKYAQNRYDDAITSAYEQILRSFPQSVYCPYTYYRLIFVYYSFRPKQNIQKVFELLARLAESFPNDAQSLDLVTTYTPIMLRDGRKDILEKLSRDFPHTRVGSLSKRKLLELKH